MKKKFPNSSVGISGIVYREDINVDSKRVKVNEMVQFMAKDNNIVYIDNSVDDASALKDSKLHLNAKGSSLLAVQFIKFLRSGSDKFNQSRRGFRSPDIQRLGKLLMELGNCPIPDRKRRRLRGTQRQFSENICSEDDLRSRIFRTFVVKFLACLPLQGFSNI